MKRLDDAVPIIEAVTAVADQEILVAAAERYGVFRRFSPPIFARSRQQVTCMRPILLSRD